MSGDGILALMGEWHRRSATQVRYLTIDDLLDSEDVVPGWTLPLRDLFR